MVVGCAGCDLWLEYPKYWPGGFNHRVGSEEYGHEEYIEPSVSWIEETLLSVLAYPKERDGFALIMHSKMLEASYNHTVTLSLPDELNPEEKVDEFLARDSLRRRDVYKEIPYVRTIKKMMETIGFPKSEIDAFLAKYPHLQ